MSFKGRFTDIRPVYLKDGWIQILFANVKVQLLPSVVVRDPVVGFATILVEPYALVLQVCLDKDQIEPDEEQPRAFPD
jgi:hypothetical protein